MGGAGRTLRMAVRVIHGDCLMALNGMEADSVDMVFADPPYNIDFKYTGFEDYRLDYDTWCREWFRECERVCRGPILITCGIANLGLWCRYIKKPAWVLCWHKPASMGRCTVGFTNWEPVLLYGAEYGRKTVDVICSAIYPDSELSGHPCPKPVSLVRRLVRDHCPPGGLILDPFAGSGTTGLAALQEGRSAILIEREPAYIDVINRRLANYEPLFATRPVQQELL